MKAKGFGILLLVNMFLVSGIAMAQSRIVVGTGVKLRAEASTSSNEVGRLSIGSVISPVKTGEKAQTIGGKTAQWYFISQKDLEGWVFGGLTEPYDPATSLQTYEKIFKDRLAVDDAQYADMVELFRLAERLSHEEKEISAQTEYELFRLKTLRKALQAWQHVKSGSDDVPTEFRSLKSSLTFSDPSATFTVDSELFWKLFEQHRDLPIADEIAWEASQNPLPGETEGYPPAVLSVYNYTAGRYLREQPKGKHVHEAIDFLLKFFGPYGWQKDMIAELKSLAADETKGMHKDLSELREAVQKTEPGDDRDKLLKGLAHFEELVPTAK
ncbi:MAG: SH3 domain-containing protein [Candidatus Riflebacteria bacterium]|nr:SH3 domain-containing protein [Candidatus Riflebacteria bacterium]